MLFSQASHRILTRNTYGQTCHLSASIINNQVHHELNRPIRAPIAKSEFQDELEIEAMDFIRQKFRSLAGFKLFKNDSGILKDSAKYTLVVSKLLVAFINLWPEKSNVSQTLAFLLMFSTCIVMEVSLIVHLLTSTEDVDSLTRVISSISIGIQSMTKMVTLFVNAKELNLIIKSVWHEFWPSNILGSDTEKGIRATAKILLFVFLTQYAAGVAFLSLYVILPLTSNTRQLPYKSWFPFDWTASPVYEILYAIQTYVTVYIHQHVVCGYDFLYSSICYNCTAQFRLLSEVIKYVGSGRENELTNPLIKIPGVRYRAVSNAEDEQERKLLVICIEHHQRLINIANRLNRIFGNGHLVQISASAMGICTTCYRISIETNMNNLTFLISYYVAHVSQLLVYCAVSNELSYWSMALSETSFQCFWYNKKYADVRKCLSIVIMRSQKAMSMNAIGLFELSYASFLTVMRFTFSLYTFLSRLAN